MSRFWLTAAVKSRAGSLAPLLRREFMASSYARADEQQRHEPMAPAPGGRDPWVCSAEEAVEVVKSNHNVFVQGIAATPSLLTEALAERGKRERLENISIYQLHTEGPCPMADENCSGIFRIKSLFIGPNVRRATHEGRADYIPIFLCETPLLFRRRIVDLDVAIVQVSPPDKHGYCSLGVSLDCTRAALQYANVVVGQINRHMPRTHGDGIIHITNFDKVVYHDQPIYESRPKTLTDVDDSIGKLVAENLVEDGATLQMGIGGIPNAVLSKLGDHKALGVHSEMFSDGVLPLVEKGVITGERKVLQPGKLVSTFLVGSKALYDFVDDNPMIEMIDVAYTNNPHIISRQKKMTAINSAIEIDITGQVVSDSIGRRMYSGVGGQVDFERGAALSQDGKAIIAMASRTSRGLPRIVPYIKEGAGVVTTRAHVHYVVTEHGIAFLFGKSLSERARALIDIAHPNDREMLEEKARGRGLL